VNGAEKTIAAALLGEQLGDTTGVDVTLVASKAVAAFGHIHGVMGYRCSTCGFKAKGPVWVMLPIMADHDVIHEQAALIDGEVRDIEQRKAE
jgi:hypothetical protein